MLTLADSCVGYTHTVASSRGQLANNFVCYCAEQVCVGLEEAVQTMKLSEVAEVIVQPQYGFGSQEHQAPQATIPADSTLFYTVELVELSKVCLYVHTALLQR